MLRNPGGNELHKKQTETEHADGIGKRRNVTATAWTDRKRSEEFNFFRDRMQNMLNFSSGVKPSFYPVYQAIDRKLKGKYFPDEISRASVG